MKMHIKEIIQKKIMEKLNRAQKCSIFASKPRVKGGPGPPGPPWIDCKWNYATLEKNLTLLFMYAS